MRRLALLLTLVLLSPGAGSAAEAVRYRAIALGPVTAHVVEVPPSCAVQPMVARERRTVRAWLRRTGAAAVLNGGYFNHRDGVGASFVTIDGRIASDPRRNQLLVHNPELAPYLPRIFDRTELRVLAGPAGPRWSLAPHHAPLPPGHSLRHALQAGPRLLPDLRLEAEGFVAFGARDARGRRPILRDSIAAYRPAARSALGLRPDGTMLLVAVPETGLTLPQLRDLLAQEGCTEAMNLDGGSSTSLALRVGDRLKTFAPPKGEAKVGSVLVVLPRGR